MGGLSWSFRFSSQAVESSQAVKSGTGTGHPINCPFNHVPRTLYALPQPDRAALGSRMLISGDERCRVSCWGRALLARRVRANVCHVIQYRTLHVLCCTMRVPSLREYCCPVVASL